MFEIIGKVDFRGSSVVLSLRVCGRFIALIKRLWDIQYYIPKQFSLRIKHGGYRAPEAGDAVISGGQISIVESVVPAVRSESSTGQSTTHPSKLHYPRSIITAPNCKDRMLSYFSEDHKYTHNFLSINFSLGSLSQNNFDFYFLVTSSPSCFHLGSGDS